MGGESIHSLFQLCYFADSGGKFSYSLEIEVMLRKYLTVITLFILLTGCAERQIDILDDNGKVVGGCIAGYDWHFYGLQDSIDYMLYQCAKDSVAQGYSITDNSLLDKDFTLPEPPSGKVWNKKLAMEYFKSGKITERKLGYILAEVEYRYQKILFAAEDDLSAGKIDKAQFNKIVQKAKFEWLGE